MRQRKNTRSNKGGIWLMLLGVAIVALYAFYPRTDLARKFVTNQKVPYAVLFPDHLPAGSSFRSSLSSFQAQNSLVCLSWVYPAQTLGGQGTVTICEQPKDARNSMSAIKDTKNVVIDTSSGRYEGKLGVVDRVDSVPDQPGQRLLVTTIDDLSVSIVAYAISDDELITIAKSLIK